jgi:hypothetical protein
MGDVIAVGALVVTIIGMMLVVAGVVATGFFLPGVVAVGAGMLGFAAAAIAAAVSPLSSGTAGARARR